MKHGFLYLTAVIDWHSRYIVGWELDDTLDTKPVSRRSEGVQSGETRDPQLGSGVPVHQL